ncbi:MAG TPA: ZIP family metal transporter, partial [Candidatus Sulfotelmatobacter sp.]|nr:ZIP family metal transporter [Candidatus Sulfotelmatobacter sp.]
MNPIATSILLGITAAIANGLGGAVVVRKDWERRYLRYFVALGAGFMIGTAMLEMLPESIALVGKRAPLLLLTGYFLVHFFDHTVTGHFHFGEETHPEEFSSR